MAGDPVVVGIDLGTSAVKVLAVTPAGRGIAAGAEFYGLTTPQPGFVEQDADVVYGATMRVLRRVVADVRLHGSEVAALGLSSAMHGILAVDEGGEPLGPLIPWMDRRAGAIAARWREDGTGAALYRETGAPMHPMLPLAKLRWLVEHEPERFARARRFVGLKELFVHRWTGEWLVDWGIAGATGMLDLRARAWSQRALALVGSGAAAGDLALTLGTSGAARVLTEEPALDGAGAALDWLFALLFPEVERAERFARAVALASGVAPGADGCTVLPFLAGERAPYWEGALRGAIVGLDLAHDRGTIVRAAVEGVVFGLFAVYAVMRELTGSATRLVLSGGLCREPLVRQVLADVFGVPAVAPLEAEASAFGRYRVAVDAALASVASRPRSS